MKKIIKLVKKAQHGDLDAFLELFQSYQDKLYRIAFVYTKNKEDSLDVMQEAAYRAFKNIINLKSPEFFKTWLIRITINCATDFVKSKKNIIPIEQDYLEFIALSTEDIPLSITLQQLMEALNEREKTVMILRFYFDYHFNEISEIMDLPLGTVKSLCYRSLNKLRNKVERTDYYEQ